MAKYSRRQLSIKAWAEEDRPREKMLSKGRQNLTDAELVAILLGSGSKKLSAIGLAQELLQSVDYDLNRLGRSAISNLMEINGIGTAKAISIIAALELGRRRQMTAIKQKPQIRSSQDAYDSIAPLLIDLPLEEFWILLLNRANRVIGKACVSTGGVSGTVVDAKVLFQHAVKALASSVILFHNHPSGNFQPSQADISLTKKLQEAGQALDIAVLDHLIVSESGYYSFADEGIF